MEKTIEYYEIENDIQNIMKLITDNEIRLNHIKNLSEYTLSKENRETLSLLKLCDNDNLLDEKNIKDLNANVYLIEVENLTTVRFDVFPIFFYLMSGELLIVKNNSIFYNYDGILYRSKISELDENFSCYKKIESKKLISITNELKELKNTNDNDNTEYRILLLRNTKILVLENWINMKDDTIKKINQKKIFHIPNESFLKLQVSNNIFNKVFMTFEKSLNNLSSKLENTKNTIAQILSNNPKNDKNDNDYKFLDILKILQSTLNENYSSMGKNDTNLNAKDFQSKIKTFYNDNIKRKFEEINSNNYFKSAFIIYNFYFSIYLKTLTNFDNFYNKSFQSKSQSVSSPKSNNNIVIYNLNQSNEDDEEVQLNSKTKSLHHRMHLKNIQSKNLKKHNTFLVQKALSLKYPHTNLFEDVKENKNSLSNYNLREKFEENYFYLNKFAKKILNKKTYLKDKIKQKKKNAELLLKNSIKYKLDYKLVYKNILCLRCFKKPRNVINNCGHLIFCDFCVNNAKICFTCGVTIESFTKLFRS